jgi:hypothetical protein
MSKDVGDVEYINKLSEQCICWFVVRTIRVILHIFLEVMNKCDILISTLTGCSVWPPYTAGLDTRMQMN